jgi:hypothetical protein
MSAVSESRETELPSSNIAVWLRVGGTFLRVIFIISLILVTLRVSMPQSETIWTAYETPADLIRMISGYAVCIGLVVQLFRMTKDAASRRVWLYLGAAAVPIALICLFTVW